LTLISWRAKNSGCVNLKFTKNTFTKKKEENMSDFNNKAIIVTGGGTGIGLAITEKFVENGAQVLITGRREAPLQELSKRFPEKVSFIQADVTNAEDRKKIIQTAINNYGQIDVLVNNAGVAPMSPFQDSTDKDFEQAFSTNLLAPAALIREAIPHLSKTKGSVVNTSTTIARYTMPGYAAYGVSKAGLNYLTCALAAELGPLGIRVNAVSPGATQTEMTKDMLNEQMTEMMVSMTPMGRLGKPTDIAGGVILLASKHAGWVTGQILDVSGGFML
jgi:NAD(P)-dependent dehydrogenase (short-subunit alcohol dehydrogenase family)